ncbi:4-aminobutyrate--2-oxoglutarate transaminase [Gordonia sp. CPCC 206044]|uniref:4-aminobutyrate--2-oxoglutarate transaminase n=1 Tax=Gordonia sp. CPCC 206044 TaxID=3140793 RepID=UPI003AF3830C
MVIAHRLPQRRHLVTDVPGPRSRDLATRRQSAVAAGVAPSAPIQVVDADGGVIVDADGNSLIDLGSGIAVTSVGASNRTVADAVAAQAHRFTHTCFLVTGYEGYVAVCEELNRRTPGDHDKRSVLFTSGAEAVENAVKIARLATGRPAVVAFDHAYHGRTNLTMALTAKSVPYKHDFGPFAPEVYRMPMSYPFRDELGADGVAAARRAITLIDSQISADKVAAVIVEPIQGEGGFVVPAPGFLGTLAEWCHTRGVVFVADEVQSGFCRTGDWFACEHEGVVPDLITTAKGIADGLPLSAVTGRADLLDAVHPGGLGGTYGGNPVACAAALATIEEMDTNDLCARARHIGTIVTDTLTETATALAADGHAVIGEVRGRGGMIAVELVRPGTTEPDPALARSVVAQALSRGVVSLTCGTYGNVVRLLPPLVIDDGLLREGLGVITDVLTETAASS